MIPKQEEVMRLPVHIIQFLFQNRTRDFIDCGAHRGNFISDYAPYCRKYVAIEPDSRNISFLTKHTSPNIIIIQAAVYSSNGIFAFHLSDRTTQNHIIKRIQPYQDNQHRFFIQTTTITEIVTRMCLNPAIIKLDIEGAEAQALRGAEYVLFTFRPVLLIEIHPSTSLDLLHELLSRHNYQLVRESGSTLRRQVFVHRDAMEHFKSLLTPGG